MATLTEIQNELMPEKLRSTAFPHASKLPLFSSKPDKTIYKIGDFFITSLAKTMRRIAKIIDVF